MGSEVQGFKGSGVQRLMVVGFCVGCADCHPVGILLGTSNNGLKYSTLPW